MKTRGVRFAAVLAIVTAGALTMTELAWAPWSTAQTDDAIDDLYTCPDGQKLKVAARSTRDFVLGLPTTNMDAVMAVNWDAFAGFPPRNKILLDDTFPLQRQEVDTNAHPDDNGAGILHFFGVVTVLWEHRLDRGATVALSFDRFGEDNYRLGTVEACSVSVSNRVVGDKRPDVILGNAEGNELVGNGDNDFIRGRAGNDIVSGDAGDDDLRPGPGADRVTGGAGNDVVHAATDDDQIDRINCGPGDDTVFLNSHEADVVADCEHVELVTAAGYVDD